MNYKLLTFLFFSLAISSCQGKLTQKDSSLSEQQLSETPQTTDQNVQNFETLNNQESADQINKQTEAELQEVEVSDRVFFNLNSPDLSDDAKKVLDTQVSWLKNDTAIKVVIEGHCDERGTREYNIALGEKRANGVKKYLAKSGIDASRISIISYGKERPAFVGSGEEIWSKNRRAVTLIVE